MPKRNHWIEPCRAAGRNVRRKRRNKHQHQRDDEECGRVERRHAEQYPVKEACDRRSARKPQDYADVNTKLCRNTSAITSERWAPSAMRMPISRVLCATEDDITA